MRYLNSMLTFGALGRVPDSGTLNNNLNNRYVHSGCVITECLTWSHNLEVSHQTATCNGHCLYVRL